MSTEAALIHPVERLNLTVSVGATAAAWWWGSPIFAASLAFGAFLEAVNFRGLHQQSQLLFFGAIKTGGGWTGLYGLRFGLLVLGIGGGLALGADPIGMLIGLSLIIPTTLLVAWRNRPAVDPTAPALDPEDPEWDRWNPWLAHEVDPASEEDDA